MDMGSIDWLGLLEKVGIALAILLVTWLLARLVRWAMTKLVARVKFLQRGGENGRSLGESLGQIAALLIWLFGLVAILQVFALSEVLTPIQTLLDSVMAFLPNIVGAVFVFFIGFVIARVIKQLIETTLGTVNFAGLFNRAKGAADKVSGAATGEHKTAAPAEPRAQVPPQAQSQAGAEHASAAQTEQMPAVPPQGQAPQGPPPQAYAPQGPPPHVQPQYGQAPAQGPGPGGPVPPQYAQHGAGAPAPLSGDAATNAKITSVIANLAFAIILVVVSIAALQILGISAIADPATTMLQLILNAIPLIIAAALILGIGFVIAKFAGDLLESTLQGLGTDRAVAGFGIESRTSASTVLARVAQVAIMLFFAIMAARTLDFPEVTNLLNEVLALGGRVLFGAAIIGAGFFIANLLARAIGSGTASTIVRYGTLVLFVAMGLQYMGIADSIINLAFGALVVGGALAAALAYGLGGRDAASRSLQKLERQAKTPSDTSSTG